MRVANVLEDSRYGGPHASALKYARAMAQKGVETHFIYSSRHSDQLASFIASHGLDGTQTGITWLTKSPVMLLKYILTFPFDLMRLKNLMRRLGCDLVQANGSYQFKAALAARSLGIPVVWVLNDTLTNPIIKKLFTLIARRCATGFIVAGQRVYDYYIKGTPLEGLASVEIAAPVDTAIFDPARVEPDAEVAGQGALRVLNVSNVNPVKGQDTFIRAAAHLRNDFPKARFINIGAVYDSQRQYHESLLELAKALGADNLVFMGGRDNIPQALKAADVFVLSSVAEASPTVVWEAMSMGLPVVTTNVGSTGQYILDRENGFIVPVGDDRAMADRISILLKDKETRRRMGLAARKTAVETLDMHAGAERHLEFYMKTAGAIA